jgi:hypothetical protein
VRDPDWLRKPGPPGEPIIYVSIPEGAKLTPQIAEALTRLSGALHDLNKDAPAKKSPCQPLTSCILNSCLPLTTSNCFRYETCRVKV